jgi:hypothetical protein
MHWRRSAACAVLSGLTLFIAAPLTAPLQAWNATGHRIIAAIAYERLTPGVRAKVDELIRRHPDYGTLFTKDAPAEPAARARAAFLYAATWPDAIRGDVRFYDETRKDATPTPLLNGFPDMGRHGTWHYYDIPYAPDGFHAPRQKPPHALSELRRLIEEIATAPPLEQAYDLPWLVHIEGDVHQPLHATSRFLQSQPKGDSGGNFVYLSPNTNLHAVWDNAAGTDISDAYISAYAAAVTAEFPAPRTPSIDPKRWLDESYRLVKSDVYTFGLETGTRERPLMLPAGYQDQAKRIARQRIALAGYRLAAVLNRRLQ